MKRILLSFIALIFSVHFSFAQAPTKLCFTTNGSNCVQVQTSNPLPVTATVTPSGTQDVNLTKILGAAPSLTNPLWVFPATGATFPISGSINNTGFNVTGTLPAFAAIPTFKTDQTTPQTTDLFTKRYDRSFLVTVSFTQGTTYAAGNSIGPTGAGNAKQTLDITAAAGVSMNNVKIKFRGVRLTVTAGTVTANGNPLYFLFPTQPAGTFTDGSTPTVSAADAAILANGIIAASAAQTASIVGISVGATSTLSQDTQITCDSTGKLYLVIQANGVGTFVTPSGYNVVLEFTY